MSHTHNPYEERHHEDDDRDDEEEEEEEFDEDEDGDEGESGYQSNRHRGETAYFERASGFEIDGGNFSTVGGHYYGRGYYPTRGPMRGRPGPMPVSNQSISYFRESSNFTITAGNFMSVSGNYYGDAPPQRGPFVPPYRGGGRGIDPSRIGRGDPRGPPQRPPPAPLYPPNGVFPPESGPHVRSSPAVLGNPGPSNSPGRGPPRGGGHSLGPYAPDFQNSQRPGPQPMNYGPTGPRYTQSDGPRGPSSPPGGWGPGPTPYRFQPDHLNRHSDPRSSAQPSAYPLDRSQRSSSQSASGSADMRSTAMQRGDRDFSVNASSTSRSPASPTSSRNVPPADGSISNPYRYRDRYPSPDPSELEVPRTSYRPPSPSSSTSGDMYVSEEEDERDRVPSSSHSSNFADDHLNSEEDLPGKSAKSKGKKPQRRPAK
ncbi:hypothetical protein GALMADRAFT_235384 [Galerina marginata CBS 339.88]|uniref:Uncharacterized protein n=1 Tax=Galerina marginata (strain CBS 339.88) TaxID=685588 RepID=A0A067U1I7_GALM3|nr:hypothetical protein GALMADRAFT_235384 [Galerina marginata CBS 339.88]